MTRAGVLLAGLLLALTTVAPSASAATRTVHLTGAGPQPATLTIHSGDDVRFVNDDSVPHQVRSQDGWQYDSGPLAPGETSSSTPRLTAPGTYTYTDLRGIVVLPQTFTGRFVVPRPAPSPRPSPSPSTAPSRTTRPSPSAPPSPPPPATQPSPPPPTAAVTPPVTPRPSYRPSPSATPTPAATSTPAPTTPATSPRYGEPKALAQPSPHRYGLPALLAGVAIGGVVSLLGRYLLAQPAGRRTRPS